MSDSMFPFRFADVQLSTGVRLHYAEQGNPANPPVILLHGYSDSWFSYSRVIDGLAQTAHVFALDQRGHGDSDQPETGYSVSDFAADVVAFMDALNLSSATVVGHSMGSLVAQQVALSAPDRVARLVLIGSATNLRCAEIAELHQAVMTLDDPVSVEFIREFQVSTIYFPIPDAFLERAITESQKLSANVWHKVITSLLDFDSTAELSRIQSPTLILRGDHDTIFPASAQQALETGIANSKVKIYSETGHALHWERPECFLEDVQDFLK